LVLTPNADAHLKADDKRKVKKGKPMNWRSVRERYRVIQKAR
jgi:hypothetical protein